jgi:hypothetical protein
MRGLVALTGWFFTSLGIVMLAVSTLVAPPNLFADAGSDCEALYGLNGSALGTCCANACGADQSCGQTCCNNACGTDMNCVNACTAAFANPKKCSNSTCNTTQGFGGDCFWKTNVNPNRCSRNNDWVPSRHGQNYQISDICSITGNAASCQDCGCNEYAQPNGAPYCYCGT